MKRECGFLSARHFSQVRLSVIAGTNIRWSRAVVLCLVLCFLTLSGEFCAYAPEQIEQHMEGFFYLPLVSKSLAIVWQWVYIAGGLLMFLFLIWLQQPGADFGNFPPELVKARATVDKLSRELKEEKESRDARLTKQINELAADYDPETAECLENFRGFFLSLFNLMEKSKKLRKTNLREIKPPSEPLLTSRPILKKTHCYFASSAVCWGSAPWQDNLTLEQNIQRSLAAIRRFVHQELDAFAIEVQGVEFGDTLDHFSETVRRVLVVLSQFDPAGSAFMAQDEKIGQRGWRVSFDEVPLFVTTFAGCYPTTNARYMFDAPRTSCWVLLQPHSSFGRHDLGPDHPWDPSKRTVRQRIRETFIRNNRRYHVPTARFYPMAPRIVPPLSYLDPFFEWWKEKTNTWEEEDSIPTEVKLEQ